MCYKVKVSMVALPLLGFLLFTGCSGGDGENSDDSGSDEWMSDHNDMDSTDDMRVNPGDMESDQATVPDDMEVEPDIDQSVDMNPMMVGPELEYPERVRFAPVDLGTRVTQLVALTNNGDAPLNIQEIVLSPAQGSPFSISIADPQDLDDESLDTEEIPSTIAAGEQLHVRVAFTPQTVQSVQARLFVRSDDPNAPNADIELLGNVDSACVRLVGVESAPAATTDFELDFGGSVVGQPLERVITIENCSESEDLTVSGVTLAEDSNGEFAITEWTAGTATAVIGPSEQEDIKVSYTPDSEATSTGRLSIATNDPTWSNANIKLTGSGRAGVGGCPIALATGVVQNSGNSPQQIVTTTPLSTVELDGFGSSDSDGSIQSYQWSIISSPTGSTTRLAPSNTSASPRLFLDLAGQYEVELSVYDDDGNESCVSSRVVILATYDQDIGVELVWSTPADSNQTDMIGADLDLHYKQQSSDWRDTAGDVFWQNRMADWDPAGPENNVSLDIDDTDGSGPEIISHDQPAQGTYNVGVYYYDDNGYGASYATVRVYRADTLIFEQNDKFFEKEDFFWYVGDVDGASLTFDNTTADLMMSGFPTN